jgi:phosphoglycerate-specific signal transduction histidine kinase
MLDLATINARDLGRIVTQAVESAQLAQANQDKRNTYQMLAAAAEELLDIMRRVRSRVTDIRDIWMADDLSTEITNGTFDFTYMTIEQVMELMAGHAALLAFFATELPVAPGVNITPNTIISRTKPPQQNWGLQPPEEQQE